jgi:hypothetical protein
VDKAGYFKSVSEYPTAWANRTVLKFDDLAQGPSRAAPWLFRCAADPDPVDLGQRPDLRGQFRLAGDLVIVDRDGVELARAKDQITKHNVGLYGGDYWAPTIMGGKQLRCWWANCWTPPPCNWPNVKSGIDS